MSGRAGRTLRAIATALLVAGCAPGAQTMRYAAEPAGAAARVWPPVASGEAARFGWIGDLVGESNFEDSQSTGRTMRRVFAAIAGLGEKPEPLRTLQRPQGVSVDAQGRVYVTDVSRKALFVFDERNGRLDIFDEAARGIRFEAPIGVAAGRDGEVLVSDAQLGEVFRLAPDGAFRGSFGKGKLARPAGIARDAGAGRTYVADAKARVVVAFDDDGNVVATLDGGGDFNAPTHLAFAGGRLYVSDSLDARVVVLDVRDGRVVQTIGRRGLYAGDLVRPKGVAVDREGHLYVVESMHDRLLVFGADGRYLLGIGGAGREPGRFFLPAGVHVDGRNRVYVADMFNGRVSVFQFLGGA